MARKKRKAAKVGTKVGARVAPKAGGTAGRAAWKLGKGEARLIRPTAKYVGAGPRPVDELG